MKYFPEKKHDFPKLPKFSKFSEISKFPIGNPIENFRNFGKFGKFWKFRKTMFFFGKLLTFFQFSRWIFYGFLKFLMLWKEEMPLVHSNSIYIYELRGDGGDYDFQGYARFRY